MTTLEILTEVEAGRMSATEALTLLEVLIPGARYECGQYTGTFIKAERGKAYFEIDSPHDLLYASNGYVSFWLEFAKNFERI